MAVTRKRKAQTNLAALKDESIQSNPIKAEPLAGRAICSGGGDRAPKVKSEDRGFFKSEVGTSISPDTARAAKSEKTSQKLKRGAAKTETPNRTELAKQPGPPSIVKKKAQPLGPFPDMKRPLPEECRAARDALATLHGMPELEEVQESAESKVPQSIPAQTSSGSSPTESQRTVLDSLVRTILSQNTTDITSKRAYDQLKAEFPSWKSVLDAKPGSVEEAVKCGGLALIKVQRIKQILETLLSETGDLSLEYVRHLDDADIKEELSRFKGVGPKTIACVLMFCLQRKEFPVDTHVWRITKSLGWVPQKASREDTYEHLNLRVPDDVKYSLHVLLVRHGKRCVRCAKGGKPRFPSDGPCPLTAVMLKGNTSDAKE